MTNPVLDSIWLGIALFLLAAHADPILLLSNIVRRELYAMISGRVSALSVVSEPSGLLMMGAGMIGLAIVTRRSNSRCKENSPVAEAKTQQVPK